MTRQPVAPASRKLRCAVYTRKSSEEGLEQDFNSLDAQREAGEACIASQRAEGWILVPDRYDDGGISGGTLDRPALARLRSDIDRGKIDVVVVYKIDRISRSLTHFLSLIEEFNQAEVTFVSVTQHLNTTTAAGRLMLNVLASFGQFEREQTGERIRDKIAASRAKGIWMGGPVPLGYRALDRKLTPVESEAKVVRLIFQRFAELGSATKLAGELTKSGIVNRKGKRFDKGSIYKVLNNKVYNGKAVHKQQEYQGEHQAIVDDDLWGKVHSMLQVSPRTRAARTRAKTPALLKGLIFAPSGRAMSPTHTRRRGKLYRYYISQDVLKSGPDACPVRRVPAGEVESAVIDQVRQLVRAPEIIFQTWNAARASLPDIDERDVREGLVAFDQIWDELFPAEQARIVQLLVDRVDVSDQGLQIHLKTKGLTGLVKEVLPQTAAPTS
ncbi:Site-specific DNA recombinase [Devosia enhydra]|uniref:Site-specific DNA recombinase n=1 Tax=Devosia enhydra TaxID=665118 RepID=A0A1K2HXT1_9HYPH|nr:recombinase family protein [Devosia enhydra]SFZ84488.1 Site-specific DNA recombinase [Devosia enhydra]